MDIDRCRSLDEAYERRAVDQGLVRNPVFPSNIQYLKDINSFKNTWGEPPPKKNNYPAIHDLVQQDIQSRKQLGIDKYGVALQPHNGRRALKDVYEELLDAACYIRQKMYEEDGR